MSESLETIIIISLVLVILWGVFLTIREYKSNKVLKLNDYNKY